MHSQSNRVLIRLWRMSSVFYPYHITIGTLLCLLAMSCASNDTSQVTPTTIAGLPDAKSAAETLSLTLPTTASGGILSDGGTVFLTLNDADGDKVHFRHDGSMVFRPIPRALVFHTDPTSETPWTVIEAGGEVDRALFVILQDSEPTELPRTSGAITRMREILAVRIESGAPIVNR